MSHPLELIEVLYQRPRIALAKFGGERGRHRRHWTNLAQIERGHGQRRR